MSAKQKRGLKNILCAGIVGLALAGCVKEAKAAPVNSNSIIKDDIEYFMQTDKSVYTLGENVQMLYRVTNLREEPVTFHFDDQVQYHFEVTSNGNLVWFTPKVGFPATSSFVLQPNGFKEYSETWDMLDNQGLLITLGSYEITGSLHPVLLSQQDKDKYVPVSVQIEIVPEPVVAEIVIEPDTLNLQSKGKWISCYIWLPEDYNVADIEPNSVLLEDEIQPEWIWFDEEEQVVMAKFSRSALQEVLADLETPSEVELTVSGELIDGTMFEGTDIIRVIDKGRGRR